MQHVQIQAYGGPEVLQLIESPRPRPAEGKLLLKVQATGVNFSDVLRRRNTYFMPTPLPYTLGSEAVGEIVSMGSAVEGDFQLGQRVLAILPAGGGYAEYLVASPQYCIPLPPQIEAAAATALFVQGSTAHLILHQVAPPLNDQTILIHAGAGGVGSLLVQLAKRAGAKVIATASNEAKRNFAQAIGADLTIDYTQDGWPQRVIEANGGEKVDLVLEMIGGKIYTQSFACLRQGGKMIVYGSASGEKGIMHAEHFVDESQQLLSFNLAHFIQHRPRDWQASLGKMVRLLAEGKIQVQTAHTYPLRDVQKAHAALENRKTTGKVVLVP